ncbi:MAG TPA: non-lysosomal glucosylceramidase [Candidatus Limnocylindrales bacterium]|nr:non-lysosomal glucosylceramidase [Candidatus Limnocylindrales bacterium]
MTAGEAAVEAGRPGVVPWPEIPGVAWSRPIGLPCPDVGHPRVGVPMTDDGEWAGVPLGGLGAGSIGPTFRGDVARWHLEVGRHRFAPIAACAFSVAVLDAAGGTEPVATMLSALPSEALPDWPRLPVGGGTYHALFPRAWTAVEPPTLPVRLVGEQLSPVVAGDYEESSLPVGVIEWTVENPTDRPLVVGLMLSWQNVLGARPLEAPAAGACAEALATGDLTAVRFRPEPGAPTWARGELTIAVAADPDVDATFRSRFDARTDRATWADFADDGRLDDVADDTASRDGEALAGAVAGTVRLERGERRQVRFAISWDLPLVEFGSGRRWRKRYTRRWGASGTRSVELAAHALASAERWRRAIVAWQAPVVEDESLPAWYRGALFNELYQVVDGGTFWDDGEADAPRPADGIGHFGLLECVDYPFYDTVDVNASASIGLLQLWPQLERSVVRSVGEATDVDDPTSVEIEATGASVRRKAAGAVPHDVGAPADDPFIRPNAYRFQDVDGWKDLGPKWVLQVQRDVRATGDLALATEQWPRVVGVLAGLARFDRDGDGLPEHDGRPDQTYDTWPMRGPSAYGGSLWLAALRAAEWLGRLLNRHEEADRFRDHFERARESFERRLWRGDAYAFDDGAGPSSDSIMADQLAGQWYADVGGLGDLLDPTRIVATLRTIHARNVAGFGDGRQGAVNGMRRDGSVDDSSEQSDEVWVGTTYTLAALMLERGLVDEAWATAAGAARMTWGRGLWFRTPEAYDVDGNFRASLYLRPLAIWALEEARRRASR